MLPMRTSLLSILLPFEPGTTGRQGRRGGGGGGEGLRIHPEREGCCCSCCSPGAEGAQGGNQNSGSASGFSSPRNSRVGLMSRYSHKKMNSTVKFAVGYGRRMPEEQGRSHEGQTHRRVASERPASQETEAAPGGGGGGEGAEAVEGGACAPSAATFKDENRELRDPPDDVPELSEVEEDLQGDGGLHRPRPGNACASGTEGRSMRRHRTESVVF